MPRFLRSRTAAVFAVLLLAAFGLALLHHHADGGDHADCAVCRLSQQIALAFGLAAAALGFLPGPSRRLAACEPSEAASLGLASDLQGRAPPSFS